MKNGKKTWEYRFAINKKRFYMGFGTYPNVGVAAAIKLKREYAELVAQGINPIQKRKKDNIETELESRDIA